MLSTRWFLLFIFSFCFLLTCTAFNQYNDNNYNYNYNNDNNNNDDAVLLENIRALTFYKGQKTTSRRTNPVQQLTCIGGSAKFEHQRHPEVVQCVNVGTNGLDTQWKCEADLHQSVRFGPVSVNCEGYSSPNDPYVLKGSCGLEYHLEFTDGYANNYDHRTQQHQYDYQNRVYSNNTSGDIGGLILLFITVFIILMLWKSCSIPSTGGVGVGGIGIGDNMYYGGNPYCAPGYGVGPSVGGGFWSGMATGGLLGYLMGRPRTSYYTGYGTPSYFPSSGYSFGGGGFGGFGGGGSRTATGYGGTTRR